MFDMHMQIVSSPQHIAPRHKGHSQAFVSPKAQVARMTTPHTDHMDWMQTKIMTAMQ